MSELPGQSGHALPDQLWQFRAKTGLMHCSKRRPHSITSSASEAATHVRFVIQLPRNSRTAERFAPICEHFRWRAHDPGEHLDSKLGHQLQ
jgi:hypothetical protein